MARRKAAAVVQAPTPKTRMGLRESLLLRGDVRFGDVMEDWQREDFLALDDPQYRHAYLERPRGHDKSGAAATEIILHLLQGPRDSQIISVAMDLDQTMIVFNDVAQKLRRGGYEARREVRILRDTIIARDTGSVYAALPSDAPSAWGLRPDLVVVDEVEEIVKRDLWDALYSALIKNPRSRVICIGTAGYSKDSLAWELRTIAEREPRWYFKSRGQCATWLDQEDLAEQRRVLRPHVFARLHLNEWVDNVGAWLTFAEVDACFGEVAEGPGRKVVAVDLGVKRDLAVATVVRLDDATGLFTVDRIQSWEAPEGGEIDLMDVQATVERLARSNKCPAVMDPWQGVLMAQQLRYNGGRPGGIEVVDDAITDKSRNAGFVFLADIVRGRRFRSHPCDALRSEMLGMELEMKPGGRYRVDHKTGKHDDHVFAVSLGCLYLGRELAPPKRKPLEGHRYDGPSNYRPAVASPTPSTHPDGIAAPGYKLCPGCDHAKPHAKFDLLVKSAYWEEKDLALFCQTCTAAGITAPKKPPNLGPHGDGTWRIYLREAREAGGAIVSRRDFGNPRDPAIKHWRENFITRCEGGRWLDDSEIVAATKENAA